MKFSFFLVSILCLGFSSSLAAQHQGMMDRLFGQTKPLASARAEAQVPVGVIEVEIVDAQDRAVAGQEVRVGVMKQAGSARDEHLCRSDRAGHCTFSKLATGQGQAYRVTVDYQGARYAARPFRLDADRGYRVMVRRLETTQDERFVVQARGRTFIEFRNRRVHVTQEAQLANLADKSYVFGEAGREVKLPSGFKAFEVAPSMSDQRTSTTPAGFVIKGSLPPGRSKLTWSFDLPLEGSSVSFSQYIPFRTIEYQVLMDALQSIELEVEGFHPTVVDERGGRRFLVASILRGPNSAPFDMLRVKVRGIPSRSFLRWLALGVALFVLALVFGLAHVRGRGSKLQDSEERADREREQERILDTVAKLHQERSRGEIGPEYYTERRQELREELVRLLH